MAFKEILSTKTTTETKTLVVSPTDIENLLKKAILSDERYDGYSLEMYDEECSQNCLKGVRIVLKKEDIETDA